MPQILDRYGRTFKTLRVSLLSRCNLGCVYCVSGDEALRQHSNSAGQRFVAGDHASGGQHPLTGQPAAAVGRHLTVPDLLGVIERLHGQLQLHTVRLTGGEPLLFNGLVGVIGGIRSIGIPEIKLTTNGFLLKKLAAPMKEAGMISVNVSLDAVEEEVFFRMSKRHSVQRVIDGIDAALEAGLDVKINTVVMKGMNDGQVLPLLEFAFSRGLRIRFLEVMGMGHLHDRSKEYLFTQDEILSLIAGQYRFRPLGRGGSATAGYWQTDAGHIFGVIANETEPFCRDCDRLRLDSAGNIYGCLSSNHPIPLQRGDSEEEWSEKLQRALLQKQALRFTGSDLSMLHIGG